jgi:hypothetical protein
MKSIFAVPPPIVQDIHQRPASLQRTRNVRVVIAECEHSARPTELAIDRARQRGIEPAHAATALQLVGCFDQKMEMIRLDRYVANAEQLVVVDEHAKDIANDDKDAGCAKSRDLGEDPKDDVKRVVVPNIATCPVWRFSAIAILLAPRTRSRAAPCA